MREDRISSPEDLDAALAGNAMRRRENLWKVAEGRSFRWADIVGVLAGALLGLTGLYGVVIEKNIDAMLWVVLGIALGGSAVTQRQQAQIDALRELLKLDHQHRS
jgi:hypothetical protein